MADDSLTDAVRRHVALFNACVDSGDWSPFVATYRPDAVLTIDDAGIPALCGRDAIGAFYAARPPREHLRVDAVTIRSEDTAQVDVTWDSGARGRLTAQWAGAEVCHVRLSPRS